MDSFLSHMNLREVKHKQLHQGFQFGFRSTISSADITCATNALQLTNVFIELFSHRNDASQDHFFKQFSFGVFLFFHLCS